jgi:hypothetical protein
MFNISYKSSHCRTWIPSAVVLAAFMSYTVIAGHPLTVSNASVSIEIFSQLQGPIAELPDQIFSLLHAYVSMQRIETYLHEGEVEDWATSLKEDVIPLPWYLTRMKVHLKSDLNKLHSTGT